MFSIKQTLKIDINPLNLADRMRKESEKALVRSGAILRGTMRRLIRRSKKKKSKPGEPPRSHTTGKEFGLKTIVYKVDKPTLSLKVGPILESSKDVPGILEKGGITAFRTKKGRIIRARIAARPFSSVTLKNFQSSYPEQWRNVIR